MCTYSQGNKLKKRYIGNEKQYKDWLKNKKKGKAKKPVEQLKKISGKSVIRNSSGGLGKVLFILVLIGLAFSVVVNFNDFMGVYSISFTGFAISENVSDVESASLYGIYEDEVVEQEFNTEIVDLEIIEPAQFEGEIITKNKNKRMDFELPEGKLILYFDLLNYSEFVEGVEEIIDAEEIEEVEIVEEAEVQETDVEEEEEQGGVEENVTEEIEINESEQEIETAPRGVPPGTRTSDEVPSEEAPKEASSDIEDKAPEKDNVQPETKIQEENK